MSQQLPSIFLGVLVFGFLASSPRWRRPKDSLPR